jgi:hypothetical protein
MRFRPATFAQMPAFGNDWSWMVNVDGGIIDKLTAPLSLSLSLFDVLNTPATRSLLPYEGTGNWTLLTAELPTHALMQRNLLSALSYYFLCMGICNNRSLSLPFHPRRGSSFSFLLLPLFAAFSVFLLNQTLARPSIQLRGYRSNTKEESPSMSTNHHAYLKWPRLIAFNLNGALAITATALSARCAFFIVASTLSEASPSDLKPIFQLS